MLHLFSYLEVIQIYFTVDTNIVLEIFSSAMKKKKDYTVSNKQLFHSAAKEEITDI